jgi:hypothetical protein
MISTKKEGSDSAARKQVCSLTPYSFVPEMTEKADKFNHFFKYAVRVNY